MSTGAELRELAYSLWVNNHRNLTAVERLLKIEHKTPVSRVSLTKWRDDGGWEARAAQAEAQSVLLKDATNIETLLANLIERKTQYDNYFAAMPVGKIDNQATYAYAGLLKRIAEMQQMQMTVVGFDKPKFFLENMQWQILWLKANDPEGITVLARNIDAMTLAYKAELIKGA